ncbi:hypothetical protein [Candidatus Venteria ishoeyi]|nr:hypothetical protein [Candidatus Venteria ishoeyi]MDM8545958.1 hypothetical protein [Candidatus Venteria ishoeyi]
MLRNRRFLVQNKVCQGGNESQRGAKVVFSHFKPSKPAKKLLRDISK